MRSKKLLSCAVGAVVATAVNVHAQDASEERASLEEVVVTAERREAGLQDTAIAITALSADALQSQGVSRPEDLNKLVPGLGIAQGGSSTQVYVRGVGNYGTNAFSDPAVAFNMDGVYIGRFSGISGNFYDIERVEVLKGPQGTLYGRNATGGAINIVTRKPENEFGVGLGLDVGNYSQRKGDGFINVPFSDTVALRAAGQWTDRDGYQSDGYDDDESKSARVHLLIEPSDALSLLLTGGYTDIGGKGPTQLPVTANGYVDNDDPWRGSSVTTPVALLGAVSPFAPPDLVINGVNRADGYLDVQVQTFTAELNADVGIGKLTVLGNYIETDNQSRSYGPGFLFQQDDTAEQTSFEARLGSESELLRWVAGLYYFQEDQSTQFWVDQGFLFNQTGSSMDALDDETLAAFTEVTFNLTDHLHLTGGVRYTTEEKDVDGTIFTRQPQAGATCAALVGAPPVFIGTVSNQIPFAATNGAGVAYPFPYCQDTITGNREWNDTSWKVGLSYDVTDDSMTYLTVNRGFKAGGFFAAGDHADVGSSFEPETLVAYALGTKNRFLRGTVQLNAEAFFWDYRDHQENYLAPLYNTLPAFGFITQSADAEIYGLDLELDVLLTDNDRLGLKAQYLQAEYVDAQFLVARPGEQPPPAPASPPTSVCPSTQVVVGRYIIDCDGQQMPRSPDLALTTEYFHTFELANGARLVPGVRVQYSSSYWSAVDYHPLQKQDSYAMYGAEIAYQADKWSVTAYGRNLSNEDVYSNSFMYPGTNVAMNSLFAPRTYGVRLRVDF